MGKIMILKAGGGTSSDELTATKDKVLTGYTAVTGDSGDDPAVGTMPNRGAVSQSLNAGGSYTIPAGYHNGAGKVTANSLSSQTSANATAAQILSGQTAWVNGAKVTGSMANRGAANQALAINGSYTIPAGYHNGGGKVTQSVPVQGGSTTTPGTANKTVVAANRYVNGNVIVAGNGNLTAGNIKKGVNIFGVTGNWEGFVATPNDLYKYGINNAGFIDITSGNYGKIIFESNQINAYVSVIKGPGHGVNIVSTKAFNLTGYTKMTLTFYVYDTNTCPTDDEDNHVRLGIARAEGDRVFDAYAECGSAALRSSGTKTIVLNISAINATKYIGVGLAAQMIDSGTNKIGIYIYQISLS